ncbi:FMN-dependent NADH-azoreductase [Mycoplasma sp. 888]|uniref:FMN-dependent NADH-azoreductase n=1 Tax=Mycoplasma sp. 888 TaxID=3108483 RepID=UPI002D79D585|nr:FMN-dependent NADH-azoreductase [Mycoplasma sp. 888]WRQ25590.1 FMN-dependent NADH-azoreductase [Mycoplasma sp. 888]
MKKILILDGNLLQNEKSYSTNILNYIEEALKSKENVLIERVDLSTTKLNEHFLTKQTFTTYYTDVESDRWIQKLKETDLLIISNPMINFGPSVIVKNFIDAISVANKTFSYKYSKQGDAIPLLTNLNTVIVSTQGAPQGWYTWGNHSNWLKGTFKFLTGNDSKEIKCFGTKVSPINQTEPNHVDEHIKEQVNQIFN